MTISAEQVKDLRDRTGAGMMECKKALAEAGGDVEKAIDAFYAEDYPGLRSLTRPRPAAVETVRAAFERGCRVAIATNPLFPRTAIEQRLATLGGRRGLRHPTRPLPRRDTRPRAHSPAPSRFGPRRVGC